MSLYTPEAKDFIDAGQEVIITNDAFAHELYYEFLAYDELFSRGFRIYKDAVIRLNNKVNQEQSFRYVFVTRFNLRCFNFLEDDLDNVVGLNLDFWSV